MNVFNSHALKKQKTKKRLKLSMSKVKLMFPFFMIKVPTDDSW